MEPAAGDRRTSPDARTETVPYRLFQDCLCEVIASGSQASRPLTQSRREESPDVAGR
jgi:hypothetical protein